MLSSNVQSIEPHGLHDLTVLADETIGWLLNICPEIYYSAAKLWLEQLAQKKKKVTFLLHVARCKILIGLNRLKCTYCNGISI